MAKKKIRIRAKMKGDVAEVKTLMSHPMETGFRKNKKTGKKIHPISSRKLSANTKGIKFWSHPGGLPYPRTRTCHSSSRGLPKVTQLPLAGMTTRAKVQLLTQKSANIGR